VEKSIYRPRVLRITEVTLEAPGVHSLRAEPADGEPLPSFAPGQFALWSAFGEGECPLALTSPPGHPPGVLAHEGAERTSARGGAPGAGATPSALLRAVSLSNGRPEGLASPFVSCTFRRVGRVTAGLSRLDVGDVVGFRGPFGTGFPVEELDGRNLLLIAGGIGLAALRSLIEHVLPRRDRFGTVTLLLGARTPEDLLYKGEFEGWEVAGLSLVLTVDPGGGSADWKGQVGLVPQVLAQLAPSPTNTLALVCGPPAMVRFTLLELERLDFPRPRVYTTLEARMKCGVGKCGHCSIGAFSVCRDGPVVSAEVLAGLADEW